jgi:hypothetical protein
MTSARAARPASSQAPEGLAETRLSLLIQFQVPMWRQICDGIDQQSGFTSHDPAIAREKQQCLDSEQIVRDELLNKWSSFMPVDKGHCVNESNTGGEASYTERLTCL